MTVDTGGPSTSGGPPDPTPPAAPRWVPARAAGVQLLGDMEGSGYREPPALVRRGDGQVLQLTPLLYRVLSAADGTSTLEDIARRVGAETRRRVEAGDVRTLLMSQLLPLGLIRRLDGGEPEVKRSDPLLRMRFRVAVTDPERTRTLTAPFARLFTPFLVVPVLLAFAVVGWWVLFERGLAAATRQAFDRPALLLLVFVITVLSAAFHEFGHAAAATRAGATPGRMGAGLYLVWPAFYTDVTDSYRLGRWGRLRTDLGGLYFNAIVAVLIAAVWLLTRDDALLLVVASQLLLMVRQLAPFVRFDGYHVLADATGVPDLFQRIGPTLRGLLPWRWRSPESRELKPWARAVITVWVLLVVPLLVLTAVLLILAFPRIVGTALGELGEQVQLLGDAGGDAGAVAGHVLAMIAIAIPVAGMAYLLVRMARQTVARTWRRTQGRPVRRGVAAVVGATLVAALAWAWWPSPQVYRPVQAYEDGTVLSAVRALVPADEGTLTAGTAGQQVVVWPEDAQRPTADDPALALVLLPRAAGAGSGDAGSGPSWVFPFDRPTAPRDGSSQALAVNTTDGSVVYNVAFALVWVEDETVDTTNEAYAFASCSGCAAVAVGFQVVLVVGQADVVVPQNIAAAVNYNCIECVSYALAQQLVLTLNGPLSAGTLSELESIWAELGELGSNIAQVPLSELEARLSEFRTRIAAVISADPAAVPGGGSAPTPAPSRPAEAAPTEEPTDEESGQPLGGTTTDDQPAPEDGAPAGSDGEQPASDSPSEPSPPPTTAPTAESTPEPDSTPAG
ncbi:hypothetical protein [Naasia sp. SYSU D00948]|uniref:hypothetical protein n=1 Tax=Naasia sp. SYSU D00948 TaxID=2817379 RepID=UPI001B310E4C|nr:hypothetical protein [Naasia sp. SYSU D00948]